MTIPTNGTTACRTAAGTARPRALLGLALAASAALACAQRERAPSADSARTDTATAAPPAAPAPARDTTAAAPRATTTTTSGGAVAQDSAKHGARGDTTGAEHRRTRAETPPSEAKRLDAATRRAAKQGASTRDTAATGRVTPPPAVRKTGTSPQDTTPKKNGATSQDSTARKAGAARGGDTTATTGAAAATSTSPAGAGGAQPSGQQASGQQAAGAGQQANDHLTASPAAYQGWKTFHVYCYRCHGVDAMGSDLAPNLRHSVGPEGSVTHEVFVTTVKEGRLPKGMPSWKALLDDQQIENLWAYLRARSSGELAPGRPRQAKQ
jgi:mono/diheme cytochrome c family protein